MRKILLAAVALGAMSSAALAEPMRLGDAQMDTVTAGVLDNLRLAAVIPVALIGVNSATSAAVGILAEGVTSSASAVANAFNNTTVDQGD